MSYLIVYILKMLNMFTECINIRNRTISTLAAICIGLSILRIWTFMLKSHNGFLPRM